MWQMETNADWTIRPAPAGSLMQFLAVRLIIDRAAFCETTEPILGPNASIAEAIAELKDHAQPAMAIGACSELSQSFKWPS